MPRRRQAGDRDGEGRQLWSLAHLALERGEYGVAHTLFGESLRIDAELGYKHGIAIVPRRAPAPVPACYHE